MLVLVPISFHHAVRFATTCKLLRARVVGFSLQNTSENAGSKMPEVNVDRTLQICCREPVFSSLSSSDCLVPQGVLAMRNKIAN